MGGWRDISTVIKWLQKEAREPDIYKTDRQNQCHIRSTLFSDAYPNALFPKRLALTRTSIQLASKKPAGMHTTRSTSRQPI
jgi:hypothetical protein